jgi:hypothetical protein
MVWVEELSKAPNILSFQTEFIPPFHSLALPTVKVLSPVYIIHIRQTNTSSSTTLPFLDGIKIHHFFNEVRKEMR